MTFLGGFFVVVVLGILVGVVFCGGLFVCFGFLFCFGFLLLFGVSFAGSGGVGGVKWDYPVGLFYLIPSNLHILHKQVSFYQNYLVGLPRITSYIILLSLLFFFCYLLLLQCSKLLYGFKNLQKQTEMLDKNVSPVSRGYMLF